MEDMRWADENTLRLISKVEISGKCPDCKEASLDVDITGKVYCVLCHTQTGDVISTGE